MKLKGNVLKTVKNTTWKHYLHVNYRKQGSIECYENLPECNFIKIGQKTAKTSLKPVKNGILALKRNLLKCETEIGKV